MKHQHLTPEKLLDNLKKIHPQLDLHIIELALKHATQAHSGQKRASGEEYINHPVNVAFILAELQVDTETIAAALLHDVIEDTDISYENIQTEFGTSIANLVQGVTKIKKYHYSKSKTRQELQAENYRKLLISITQDFRVILIKLADRLHNMRTLNYKKPEDGKRIAQETLDVYIPLANRFGIARIKWELEDLCLKHLYNKEYYEIKDLLDEKKQERDNDLQRILKPMREMLEISGIETEVSGRSKHFYSIYRKHIVRKVPYSEIFDLVALRIIVNTVEECYEVLGLINQEYEPIHNRFRDYISRPKPNNYQSLHLIVKEPEGKTVEIQIRTHEMHLVAEEGIAAHWRYKELKSYKQEDFKRDAEAGEKKNTFHTQISGIRSLLKNQEKSNSNDFLNSLKLNLYSKSIVVSTPQGDYITLPKDATPIDFAYSIHTKIGEHTIGARVNNKFVALKTELHNGDVIEIQTSPRGTPSKDWLKHMKSSKARQKVRAYFRQKELEDAIVLGEEIFIKKSRKLHLKFSSDEILELAHAFKLNDMKTFFAKLGKGELLFDDIKLFLEEKKQATSHFELPRLSKEEIVHQEQQKARGVRIQGVDNLMLRYAKCCNPIPGDEIIGYTTRGRGITVHRKNCGNRGFQRLMETEKARIINLEWDLPEQESKKFLAKLKVYGSKDPTVLMDIMERFSLKNIDIQNAKLSNPKPEIIGTFTFRTANIGTLQKIIAEVMDVKGVHRIERVK